MPCLKLKPVVALLSTTAALSACDSIDTLHGGSATTAEAVGESTLVAGGVALSRPDFLQSRDVVRQLLRPVVKLGADPDTTDNVDERATVVMSERGDQWVGGFSLPDDTGTELAEYPLDIEWVYDINTTPDILADDIILARADTQIITNASSREIRVSTYETDAFDEDNDGMSNLDELNANQDPLSNQGDCRDLPAGLLSRLAPVITLSSTFSETQSIDRANGMVAFGQAFSVQTRGNLSIQKASGLPNEAAIVLFDREEDSDEARPLATDNVAPLSIAATLDPGLYCLGVVVADLDNQVFTDVVMRYNFAP